MNLTIKPTGSLGGTVEAPPSKSYTHRAIIVSSLADGTSIIKNPLLSADTLASIDACRMLGADIDVNDVLTVRGISGKLKAPRRIIDVQNSGTSIRIMTAIVSLCDDRVELTGDESIQKRPMKPLLDALEELGVKTTSRNGNPPVSVHGPMNGGKCSISGDVSSQFISGLLIACPLASKDIEIEIIGELKSRPYVELTLDTLKDFNVEIRHENFRRFYLKGNQRYKARTYRVEGDYSSASFILCAAALTDSAVTIKNLSINSKQGDMKIIKILRDMGAKIEMGSDQMSIQGNGNLSGIDIDLSQTPDLLPIVSVIGALAKDKTIISGVEHARYKECDRIHAMTTQLRKMNAVIKERRDGMEIEGVERLKGARVHGWHDHRVVMALAVAGLRADGNVSVDTAESVPVSFPTFVEVMKKLGAEISIS